MYKRILVPVEHSSYDDAILAHVRLVARFAGSSIVIIHVADGWVARNMKQLDLRESEEMRDDRDYIEKLASSLSEEGIPAEAILAGGSPGAEILAAAEREGCDLIAMSTHGHRFLNDLVRGSVANTVRHGASIPVLLVRGTHPQQSQ